MWFYFGIFTTIISLIIYLHQKLAIQSALQKRNKELIPISNSKGKYKFSWSPSTDKTPAYLHLEVECKTLLQFSARHETSRDKWGKAFGLSHECQTGEKEFDEKVYLASITQTDAEIIGNDSELRHAINQLLADLSAVTYENKDFHHQNEIICDGVTLYIKLAYKTSDSGNKAEFTEAILEQLNNLASRLQAHQTSAPHFWKVPTQRNSAIILAVSSTLAVLGGMEALRFIFLGANQLFNPFAIVPATLVLSALGLLFLIAVTLKFIKKSARRHLIFIDVCMSGFFGLFFSIYGWVHDFNIELDNSKPQIMNFKVAEKYTEQHRSRRSSYTTYHLRLEDAQHPVETRIKIRNSLYMRLSNGDFVTITIRNGYLNQPWLENIKQCNSCENDF